MQEEATTLDGQEALDQKSVDIKSLLDAVNSSTFDEAETLLRSKDAFEKAESFFDLIRSDNEMETSSISKEEVSSSNVEFADQSNEPVDEVSSEEKSELEQHESDTKVSKFEESIDDEATSLEESIVNEVSTENKSEQNKQPDTDETEDNSFETVNVVTEVIDPESQEQGKLNESEATSEQSEEYQRGYQDALMEFENTLGAEKKSIAEFANTLFAVRDDLSILIEEALIEKVQEIGGLFLGKYIDEAPTSLVQRAKEVSLEIVERTSEIIIELNEIDATAFIESSTDMPFKVVTTSDLGRGEFRIIAGKSGYHQKMSK